MIELKLTFYSVAAMAAYVAKLPPLPGAGNETGKGAETGGAAASPPPAGARTKPADSAAPAKDQSASNSPAPAADVPKYETSGIGELIQKAVGSKGQDTVKAALKELGVTKGSQLKAEQFAEAKAKFEKLLAPADDADLAG